MSDIITVFEDRQVKLNLTENQKQDIIELKSLWGSQNLSMQADGTLLMQHYVGYVSRNGTHIQVLPKIYGKDNIKGNESDEAQRATELLFRLLAYSGYIGINEIPDPQKISKCQNDLLEIFITIFLNRFLKLFTSDIYRQYEASVDNMQFIKGKILFQETLKKNLFTKHKHYVEYDEFTVNTTLNRIFKTVMLKLLHETNNSENKKMLKLSLVYLEDVDLINLSSSVFDRVRFNRLNTKYEPLFRLVKMFYYNYQPGLKEGDENTFTFLVPLNKLFEYFIYKVLEECEYVIDGKLCRVVYQKPQEYLAQYNNSGIFTLKPDISIMQGKKVIIILDAKYKNPFYQGKVQISQADVYQMLAYGVHYNCKAIFLIYPAFRGGNKETELAEYFIPTSMGQILIKVIQVDIMENNFDRIKEELQKVVSCIIEKSNDLNTAISDYIEK